MTVLPDLLAAGLDLVIVGTAAGLTSAERRCYYAGTGNRLWHTLHEIGLTPILLLAASSPARLRLPASDRSPAGGVCARAV